MNGVRYESVPKARRSDAFWGVVGCSGVILLCLLAWFAFIFGVVQVVEAVKG